MFSDSFSPFFNVIKLIFLFMIKRGKMGLSYIQFSLCLVSWNGKYKRKKPRYIHHFSTFNQVVLLNAHPSYACSSPASPPQHTPSYPFVFFFFFFSHLAISSVWCNEKLFVFLPLCVCRICARSVCVCMCVSVYEMNFLPPGRGSVLTEISLHHPLFNLLSVSAALCPLLQHAHHTTQTEYTLGVARETRPVAWDLLYIPPFIFPHHLMPSIKRNRWNPPS